MSSEVEYTQQLREMGWSKYGIIKLMKRVKRAINRSNVSSSKENYSPIICEPHTIALNYKEECEICGKVETPTKILCVDHCHTFGKFRGWLCLNCNSVVGHCKEDITILESAIAYLKKHQEDKVE